MNPRGSFTPLRVTRLRVKFRSQGVQWPLRENDGIEVETADGSVGALSGEAIRHLIQHHLANAALQAYIVEDLRQQLDHLRWPRQAAGVSGEDLLVAAAHAFAFPGPPHLSRSARRPLDSLPMRGQNPTAHTAMADPVRQDSCPQGRRP